jgi:uncharacterized damage-inducible protein DinB
VTQPEVWLRGPIDGVPAALQPVAHALRQALEDVGRSVDGLPPADLWRRPGPVASVGFHLTHLAGATDRLFTYARGEPLSEAQRAWLAGEKEAGPESATPASLLAEIERVFAAAMAQLAATPIESLATPRSIGRAQLPSTVLGCLFHAAEHAARHAGQIVTTVKILRG